MLDNALHTGMLNHLNKFTNQELRNVPPVGNRLSTPLSTGIYTIYDKSRLPRGVRHATIDLQSAKAKFFTDAANSFYTKNLVVSRSGDIENYTITEQTDDNGVKYAVLAEKGRLLGGGLFTDMIVDLQFNFKSKKDKEHAIATYKLVFPVGEIPQKLKDDFLKKDFDKIYDDVAKKNQKAFNSCLTIYMLGLLQLIPNEEQQIKIWSFVASNLTKNTIDNNALAQLFFAIYVFKQAMYRCIPLTDDKELTEQFFNQMIAVEKYTMGVLSLASKNGNKVAPALLEAFAKINSVFYTIGFDIRTNLALGLTIQEKSTDLSKALAWLGSSTSEIHEHAWQYGVKTKLVDEFLYDTFDRIGLKNNGEALIIQNIQTLVERFEEAAKQNSLSSAARQVEIKDRVNVCEVHIEKLKEFIHQEKNTPQYPESPHSIDYAYMALDFIKSELKYIEKEEKSNQNYTQILPIVQNLLQSIRQYDVNAQPSFSKNKGKAKEANIQPSIFKVSIPPILIDSSVLQHYTEEGERKHKIKEQVQQIYNINNQNVTEYMLSMDMSIDTIIMNSISLYKALPGSEIESAAPSLAKAADLTQGVLNVTDKIIKIIGENASAIPGVAAGSKLLSTALKMHNDRKNNHFNTQVWNLIAGVSGGGGVGGKSYVPEIADTIARILTLSYADQIQDLPAFIKSNSGDSWYNLPAFSKVKHYILDEISGSKNNITFEQYLFHTIIYAHSYEIVGKMAEAYNTPEGRDDANKHGKNRMMFLAINAVKEFCYTHGMREKYKNEQIGHNLVWGRRKDIVSRSSSIISNQTMKFKI